MSWPDAVQCAWQDAQALQQLLALLGELPAEDVDERGAVRFVLRSLARRSSQNGLSPEVCGPCRAGACGCGCGCGEVHCA